MSRGLWGAAALWFCAVCAVLLACYSLPGGPVWVRGATIGSLLLNAALLWYTHVLRWRLRVARQLFAAGSPLDEDAEVAREW